jgi:hypothetical protein
MKGCAVFSLVLALALALSAVPATAAHTASAVVGYYGVYYPVIGGGAILTLTVKNLASSTHSINKVVLDFEASGFKVVWANGAGWATSNTETTCTYEVTGIESPIAPNATKMFSTKVTLPWTIAQYDFLVTTTDSVAYSASFRTGNKVNVSYSSCGNADAVDLFHASSTPTANMLLPLGGDAKYDGAILRDATVSGAKLMDGAVTSAKLGAASVGSLSLIDGAVTTAKLADGSITTAKIVDGAVTTAKLTDVAVTSDKIAAGSITNSHLAAESVAGANIQANAVSDDKITNLWRTVNLPITGAQFVNGAVVSPDGWWVGVDFPVPPGPSNPSLGLTIEMPADWDPVANPQPYVELLWFADDSVNNRGKTVRWWLTYARKRAGQPYLATGGAVQGEWTTDPVDARVIQTTADVLRMTLSGYKPEVPNEVMFMRITRQPATTGVELPDEAHLIAAQLWYQAKR